MLRLTLSISALAAVLATAGAACAFEETKQRVAPAEPSGQAKDNKNPAPLNLDGTGTSIDAATPPTSGSDIRIPGLGKLGVWPKLDFGLELLYGGRESGKSDTAETGRADPADGMQIKGHIKHRW